MTTRQEGQAILYDDAEDMSNLHEISIQPTTPCSNSIAYIDGETATEYSSETSAQRSDTTVGTL